MAIKMNYLDNQQLQALSEEELKYPATGIN